MISLNVINSEQARADFVGVMQLIELATDPKKCAAQLRSIKDAVAESSAILADAANLRANFAKERAALDAERAAQEKQLVDKRSAFEEQCIFRNAEIDKRAAQVARLQAEAQEERKQAAQSAKELSDRLDRIKAAAA